MNPSQLRKYLVMGSSQSNRDPLEVLEEAISGGITAFQYREKGQGSLEGESRLQLGRMLRSACKKHQVLFVVNDDLDLALELEADALHLGQDDQDVSYVRQHYPELILGLSVSTIEELNNSRIDLVDYIGAGPIYSTNTKQDAKKAVGPSFVKEIKEIYPSTPVVGIGGITPINASEVIEAGADGVAVVSAIVGANDVEEAVRSL